MPVFFISKTRTLLKKKLNLHFECIFLFAWRILFVSLKLRGIQYLVVFVAPLLVKIQQLISVVDGRTFIGIYLATRSCRITRISHFRRWNDILKIVETGDLKERSLEIEWIAMRNFPILIWKRGVAITWFYEGGAIQIVIKNSS